MTAGSGGKGYWAAACPDPGCRVIMSRMLEQPPRRRRFRLRGIPWWNCIKLGTFMGVVVAVLSWGLSLVVVTYHRPNKVPFHFGIALILLIPFCIAITILGAMRGKD